MTIALPIRSGDSRVKDSTFGIAVSIAAGITTLAIFFRRAAKLIWRGFSSPVRWVGEQTAAARKIVSFEGKLQKIIAELSPDGGKSLKDVLSRVDERCERLEDALALKAQRVRALLTDSIDGVFELDPAGNLRWANRTLCRMLGRQTEELLERGWEQAVCSDERESVIEEWDRCVQVGREMFMNIHFCHISGERVFLQVHSYPMRNDNSMKLIGFFAYCRAIPPELEHK